MKACQAALVRDSFALVRPSAKPVAALFYDRLFRADPGLRKLYRGDLPAQGERLMAMIGLAVDRLDRPDLLLPTLRDLGARHAGYGVVAAHYDAVGQALLGTLAEGLGDRFTPETRDAWVAVYGVIAATMTEGAQAAVAIA